MSLHAHKLKKSVIIKADTGASRHYFKIEDKHILQNIKKMDNPPGIQLPENTTITAVEQGSLFLHKTDSTSTMYTNYTSHHQLVVIIDWAIV